MALVAASSVILASCHWMVRQPDRQLHNILYNLNFIPIVIAAMLFGWRGSVAVTALTMAVEVPQMWIYWPNDRAYRFDQFGETATTGIAGVVIGLLAARTKRQNVRLAHTTAKLETVNRELQQNMERLAKAERLYAVAQLSASLAHEIRNPLESISAAAGILRRGHANPDNVTECFEIIDMESRRLNKLLADFLTFARPRTPRFQPTDLVEVMDSVVALARHSSDAAAIEFQRRVEGAVPEVQCDSEQLKQVLFNVLMNAVQATVRGRVDLTARAYNGSAFIVVRDQGPGVPQHQQDRIFEPFFTTRDKGSGLGLAIAATIVEQHGGSLTAVNEPGSGLAITIQLPVQQEAAA
jgi:signal transduction histidine kinase